MSRTPRPSRLRALLAVVGVALLSAPGDGHAGAQPDAGPAPIVAVAANLTAVATALAAAFTAATGQPLRLSFGASGNLARQILRGAPFELFISADEDYPRRLVAAGRTRGGGAVYAIGRLALYLAPGSGLSLATEREPAAAFTRVLSDPSIQRIAIANPEHAPYGRAAREVLRHLGAWPLAGRMVMGENVAQTARFAGAGGVQAALLPLSLVRLPALEGGSYRVVPDDWHAPIRQRMVLIAGAGAAAESFYHFVLGAEARAVLEHAGYRVPAG